MNEIKLDIYQSAPLFMMWFDCQMDHLVKPEWGYYSDLRSYCDSSLDTDGYPLYVDSWRHKPESSNTRIFEQDGETFRLEYEPYCSYLEYRFAIDKYKYSNKLVHDRLPLHLELVVHYLNANDVDVAESISLPRREAFVLGLESRSPTQVRLYMDYRIDEADPLSWLLRRLAEHDERVVDQLSVDILSDLSYSVSDAEWAKWKTLDRAMEKFGQAAEPEELAVRPTPVERWERIPAHNWDREALKLWLSGHTCPEIGRRLSIAEATVRNRLSSLRGQYGEDVVPTAKQLRKMRIR